MHLGISLIVLSGGFLLVALIWLFYYVKRGNGFLLLEAMVMMVFTGFSLYYGHALIVQSATTPYVLALDALREQKTITSWQETNMDGLSQLIISAPQGRVAIRK